MKKLKIFLAVIVLLTVTVALNRLYNENKKLCYDSQELKKIAWDSLSDYERKTVVKDSNVAAFVGNEQAGNFIDKDVWKYARIGTARYKDIPSLMIKVKDETMIKTMMKKLKRWYMQNYKVVRVEFDTTDAALGSITLYLDPDAKTVMGYALRF